MTVLAVLAALLLVLVLPAAAGAFLLSGPSGDARRALSPDILVARGLACGLATWLLGSGLLTRTVGLTPAWCWAWDGLVAAASLAVLLHPRNLRRLKGVLVPGGIRLGAVAGLTALVFLPLGAAIVRTSWSPLGSTPWYYYGLARQVADLGSIPATSIEFGSSTPFLNDYHLFTTGTAMLLVQHPGGPITTVIVVTLIAVLLFGVGMVALASALGAGRLAALLALPVALAAGIGSLRLVAYRPEGLALGMTLLLVALGIDWLARRDVGSLVAAALLAATLSQVHGIAAMTAGVMLAAAAVVWLVRGPRREQLIRTGIAAAAMLAAVVVTGLVFREASGTVHAGGLVDRGGLGDPTWEFYRAARGWGASMPPANHVIVHQAWLEMYDAPSWWLEPLLALTLIGLLLRWRTPAARQVVLFTLLSLLGLLAVACVFMFGWHGYVPRRTGASRIVLEASLLGPPLAAIGLEGLTTWRWRWHPALPAAWARWLVLLTAMSVCAVFSVVKLADYYDDMAPTRADLAVWRSLPVTSADVILANAYTEGFIPDVTGAKGLLDGRAPYTFDDQLHSANRLLRGAQAFYDDPRQHWGFLADNDVSWVVVGDSSAYGLGTGNIWKARGALEALQGCAGLERVTGDRALTVFRVIDPGPNGC